MNKILVVSALALTLGACSPRDDRVLTGAAVGGAAGAVVGGVATGTAGGAIAGGAIGAVGGAVIADATRPRGCYVTRSGRTVCRR
jgi:osmotically inducible lipoprotein OsmB